MKQGKKDLEKQYKCFRATLNILYEGLHYGRKGVKSLLSLRSLSVPVPTSCEADAHEGMFSFFLQRASLSISPWSSACRLARRRPSVKLSSF